MPSSGGSACACPGADAIISRILIRKKIQIRIRIIGRRRSRRKKTSDNSNNIANIIVIVISSSSSPERFLA